MTEKGPRDVQSLDWHYRIEPSQPLPILDLSQSLKSRYLADRSVHRVNRIIEQNKVLFFYSYAISLLLSTAVPLVNAETGRIAAVLAVLLCLPFGLGGLGALRYQVVRSLLHTDIFWFFITVNSATQIFSAMMFSDLRALRSVVDWINFANVVFIDARLRGIRAFANLSVLGLVNAVVLAVLAGLNRVDDTSDHALWYYRTKSDKHELFVRSYVANGLGTLIILIAKFLYRMRKSLRLQQTSNVVNCVVYRCQIKLVSCSMMHLVAVAPSTARVSIRRPPWIQQMVCVQQGDLFDARNTLFPIQFDSRDPFAYPVLLLIYSSGVTSLLTLALSIREIGDSTKASNGGAVSSWASLICAVTFFGIFMALYQRQLLKDVVTSFDFAFNSIQLSVVHCIAAALHDWETRYCMCLVVSWLWIHWTLTLDALTPMMKTKLRFQTRLSIPILLVFAFGCVWTLAKIYAGSTINDLLWTGTVFGNQMELHVLTFFTQRLETLLIWMIRMLLRLAYSSNEDATILRGTLAYSNYMLNSARMGQNLESAQRTNRSRRMTRLAIRPQRVQPAPLKLEQ